MKVYVLAVRHRHQRNQIIDLIEKNVNFVKSVLGLENLMEAGDGHSERKIKKWSNFNVSRLTRCQQHKNKHAKSVA